MDRGNRKKGKQFGKNRRKFDKKTKFGTKRKKRDVMDDEIQQLQAKYSTLKSSEIKTFMDIPLTEKSQNGLKDASYSVPTEIQRESIGLALQGNDILGAAKTGSGKTLAFIIPVLECLYRMKWSAMDGLGALIISPTRELAYQIFEVLRKVGKHHDFSAGLVIGGKHLRDEAERINRTNIVICTPGRLLQHMDETVMFNCDNLQILVLDEADRILDMGFQQTMNAVIQNLPPKRQTLLFSATQTKSVKDLARLSLKDPIYVSMHENSQHSTPSQLIQSYVVCPLHRKLDMLWSFLRNHPKSKILVFMASCKQVRFVHESFRHLRPGVPVMALHGAMQQLKRVAVYEQFCRKQKAILFATDIAARGLDFPAVNWVVQLDCPEDANTYIHRAGRTARYEKDGEALLVLLPTEETTMVAHLEEKKIPINLIKVNPKKMGSIQGKLESLCASDVTLKEYAQRAFMSYLKSVFYMSDKKVFDVSKLDSEKFARSLGLAMAPRVRFLQKQQKLQEQKLLKQENGAPTTSRKSAASEQTVEIANVFTSKSKQTKSADSVSESRKAQKSGDSESENDSESEDDDSGDDSESGDDDSDEESDASDSERTKKKSVKAVKTEAAGPSLGADSFSFGVDDDDEEEEDDILKVKRVIQVQENEEEDADLMAEEEAMRKAKVKVVTKFTVAKKLQKKKMTVNTKVVFDEEGEAVSNVHKEQQRVGKKVGEQEQKQEQDEEADKELGGIDIESARKRMQKEDLFDKELYREKIKKRHREERLKAKEERRKKQRMKEGHDDEEEPEAFLDNDGPGFDPDELPDPDKVYGSGGEDSESGSEKWDKEPEDVEMSEGDDDDDDDDDEDDSEDEDDDDEEEDEPRTKKPRVGAKIDSDFETGLDLADDEALALRLLQNS